MKRTLLSLFLSMAALAPPVIHRATYILTDQYYFKPIIKMEIAITIKSNTAKEAAVLLGKAMAIITNDLTDEDINTGCVQVAGHGIDFAMKVFK